MDAHNHKSECSYHKMNTHNHKNECSTLKTNTHNHKNECSTLKTNTHNSQIECSQPNNHSRKDAPINSHSPSPYPPETCPSAYPSTHHTPSKPSQEPHPPFAACDESRFPPPPYHPSQGCAESPSPPSQYRPPHPCGKGTAYGYTSHTPPSPTDLSQHWQRCSRATPCSAPRFPSSTTPHSALIRLPLLASQQAHSTASSACSLYP